MFFSASPKCIVNCYNIHVDVKLYSPKYRHNTSKSLFDINKL